jgi:ribose transport system substrate-binding protein
VRVLPLSLATILVLSACSTGTSSSSGGGSNANIGAFATQCAAHYDGPLKALPTSYPEPSKQDLKIGFLQPLGANETVGTLQKFVEKHVAALGGTTIAYDAEEQPDKQVTQLEQLLNQGVKAIIVFPVDASALNPVIAKAKTAGVPVVGIEVDPDGGTNIGNYATQVVQGRDQHAYVHACVMAKLHPGGEVAVVGSAAPVPSLASYVTRVTFWAKKFGLNLVGTASNQTDDVAGGATAAGGILSNHPNLQGIMAYNDPTAIGAHTAARTQSRDLTVFGVNGGSDAFAAIKDGKEDLSLQHHLDEWSKQLVAAAYDAVQQPQTALPKTTFPAADQPLTADSIGQAVPWKQQLDGAK